MRLLSKIIKRGLVLWCLYGVGKVLCFTHPFVMGLGAYISDDLVTEGNAVSAAICLYTILIMVIATAAGASIGLHCFSKWLFNERN